MGEQRGLAVLYSKMGNLEATEAETAAARDWHGKALTIQERLAALDPANVKALVDLSSSYKSMATLAEAALSDWLIKAQALLDRLAVLDTADMQAQLDLYDSYMKMAEQEAAATKDWLSKAQALLDRLAVRLS